MPRPSFLHLAPETADRLTRSQAQALMLLDPVQPTRQSASGVANGVFKALRSRLLARSGPNEAEWFATEFGLQVQDVIKSRGGMAWIAEAKR